MVGLLMCCEICIANSRHMFKLIMVVLYISEEFACGIGTRQGCMISPFLFRFYLNELIPLMEDKDCQGVYVNEYHANINMLLYADDLVIVGDYIGRVQKVLNTSGEFCKKWRLQVNMSKTKLMVFRNGGIIKQNKVLYFDGQRLGNVSPGNTNVTPTLDLVNQW